MAAPESMRKIIHIDMDAFFASVEQRDNPDLAGKPVAVGRSRKRGVVAAASYEARAFGVHSAMPSVTAQRKCPELIFVPPRFDVYKSVSADIRAVFARYTDLIEPLSLDEAYLDVTSNKQGLPTATEVALAIKRDIKQSTGLTASAGVSINKFLAKVASDVDKPDGLFVVQPQRAQQFIDQLAIEKFFGIGKVTARKMRELGIQTGANLKAWAREDLVNHFGKAGHYFYDVAHGEDNRPVVVHRERKSIGAERTFSDDLHTLTALYEALRAVAEEVARRVAQQRLGGRTVTLKIKFADFRQITRSHSFDTAIDDFESLYHTAKELLEQNFTAGMRIRLLGITLSSLHKGEQEPPQLTLEI